MTDLLRVTVRTWRRIFSDSGVLLLLIGIEIAYPLIYPLPYKNQIVTDVPVALVDLDGTGASRKLTRMIDASPNTAVAARYTSFAEAEEAVAAKECHAAVVIPEGFARKIARRETAEVAGYFDATTFLVYNKGLEGVVDAVDAISTEIQVARESADGTPILAAKQTARPVRVRTVYLANRSGSYLVYIVPAVFILILQQSLLLGVGTLMGTDSEKDRFFSMAAKWTGATKVAAGRTIALFALFLVHVVYFLGVLFVLYDFPLRCGLFVMLVFLTPYLLACIGMAMTLGGCFRERETAIPCLLCTSIPFLLVGGVSWPVSMIPRALYYPLLAIPSTLGIDGFARLSGMGASLYDVCDCWFGMWALATAYFVLSVVTIRAVARRRTAEMRRPNGEYA